MLRFPVSPFVNGWKVTIRGAANPKGCGTYVIMPASVLLQCRDEVGDAKLEYPLSIHPDVQADPALSRLDWRVPIDNVRVSPNVAWAKCPEDALENYTSFWVGDQETTSPTQCNLTFVHPYRWDEQCTDEEEPCGGSLQRRRRIERTSVTLYPTTPGSTLLESFNDFGDGMDGALASDASSDEIHGMLVGHSMPVVRPFEGTGYAVMSTYIQPDMTETSDDEDDVWMPRRALYLRANVMAAVIQQQSNICASTFVHLFNRLTSDR